LIGKVGERNVDGNALKAVAPKNEKGKFSNSIHPVVKKSEICVKTRQFGAENIPFKEFIEQADKTFERVVSKLIQEGKICTAMDYVGIAKFSFRHGIQNLARHAISELDNESLQKHCYSGLHHCAKYGWEAEVRKLVDSGVDVNSFMERRTALYYASEEGLLDIVLLLMERGADPNAFERFDDLSRQKEDDCSLLLPIQIAVQRGNEAVVEVLVNNGAIVQASCGTSPIDTLLAKFPPLQCIANNQGHAGILQVLLQKGIDSVGDTVLHRSATAACYELVESLLQLSADPNKANAVGETALHLAVSTATGNKSDVMKVVNILLKHGADPNIASKSGETPLYRAAKSGHLMVVKLLILAKINETTLNGCATKKCPLTVACEYGHEEIVRELLERGADPNVLTTDDYVSGRTSGTVIPGSLSGVTPLFVAALNGFVNVVADLLEFEVNVSLENQSGETILHHMIAACGALHQTSSEAVEEIQKLNDTLRYMQSIMESVIEKVMQYKSAVKELLHLREQVRCCNYIKRFALGQLDCVIQIMYAAAQCEEMYGRVSGETPLNSGNYLTNIYGQMSHSNVSSTDLWAYAFSGNTPAEAIPDNKEFNQSMECDINDDVNNIRDYVGNMLTKYRYERQEVAPSP
jgi:ankyrin repeat protein